MSEIKHKRPFQRVEGAAARPNASLDWTNLLPLLLFCFLLPASASTNRTVTIIQAIQETLAREPNIQIQVQQFNFAKGVKRNASGQFDPTLDAAISRGITRTPRTELERIQLAGYTNITETVADLTDERVGVTKQFRSGPSISTGVEVTRYEDNFHQEPPLNRANINLVLNVPLLRGFGRDVTGAFERAASVSQEAAAFDLQHVVATRILAAATAYWNALAAQQQLQVLRDTEAMASALVDRVKQLIQGQEVPAAELKQVEADYADKTSARIGGEQTLDQARQALGLAMGLSSSELIAAPLPEDSFPTAPTGMTFPQFEGQTMVEKSLIRRPDYQSSLKSGQAAEILKIAARKNLKPQLDLNFEVGYAGLDQGSEFQRYYSSIDPRSAGGLNTLGTLRFSFPFGNNAAKGLLEQREALQLQSSIRTQDLARNIGSEILLAFSDLDRSSQQLSQATQAAALYRQAVQNEREKLRIGASTLIDVITLGDRLSNSLLSEIGTKAHYANALIRLRFETGLLVPVSRFTLGGTPSDLGSANAHRVRPLKIETTLKPEDFVTIPSMEVLNSALAIP